MRAGSEEMLVNKAFRVVALAIPPYPTAEGVGVLLKTLEKTQPKARAVKAEDFIDARLVRELDESGFINRS